MKTSAMESNAPEAGRLTARPVSPKPEASLAPGLHPIDGKPGRDALLYVPPDLPAHRPVPLVVMLHGAGGQAEQGTDPLHTLADARKFLLLAPASRGRTWDVIARNAYGPDITFLDAALEGIFEAFPVDAKRLAIAGFSDGASYALSLAVMNGDLFTHCLAFAPGFMAPLHQTGTPAFYLAHGTRDEVLNIDRCSRRLAPKLERAGYRVHYHEFDGPHILPPFIAEEALSEFMENRA